MDEYKPETTVSIPQSWWTNMLVERDSLKTEVALLKIKIASLTEAGDGLYSMVWDEFPSASKNGCMSEWAEATNEYPAQ
jgi:hypothetical protein